jgi:DNA invertase Pin-like site-specific DNA recombinase
MSSNPQEKSIPQQRAEMLPRCQLEGIEITKEFRDEGKSGGGMKKRDDFKAMLAFCRERHQAGEPIDAIVCYDPSRFSRADSNETGHAIWEFRQVGVNRLLAWERWYDFRKEDDRAIFNLQQDFTNNRYLRDLSARVLRGKKDVAAAGFFTGGTVPYGFDRVLVDGAGNLVQRFHRGEKVRLRKQGWHEVLSPIPADEPDPARQLERQTTTWILETFHRDEVSFRWLAEQLNLRQVPAPGLSYRRKATPATDPAKWNVPAVRRLLVNPVYKGVARTGAAGTGAYHRLGRNEQTGHLEIHPVHPGTRRTSGEGVIFAKLDHGGYVSAEVWDAIQAKVGARASQKMRRRASGYVLPSGILYCGHCGHRMYGCHMRPKRGEKVYDYRKYVCSASNVKPGICKHYSIDEDVIVGILRERLLREYLAPERLRGIEEALTARSQAQSERAPAEADRLRARLAGMDEDIKRGRRRALKVQDDATFAELNEGLRELLDERQRLEAQLKAAEQKAAVPVAENAGRIGEALAKVRALREELGKAKGRSLGVAIGKLVTRADLFFVEEFKGARRWYSFTRGAIKVRPLLNVQGLGSSDK